jgi:hypothetical protein
LDLCRQGAEIKINFIFILGGLQLWETACNFVLISVGQEQDGKNLKIIIIYVFLNLLKQNYIFTTVDAA